ncbi:hypothetical protein [Chryseobacterium gleum]|uniref:hypothetical protein n=1 Tax=Chryseobacterium gleum TaxID=250 RepID=UPI0028A1DFAA|nr:hypothetical protein [Chryseobacterium gleum]
MEYFSTHKIRSSEITKFICTCGIFSLLLKNGTIIHIAPEDVRMFNEWLKTKHIENIKPGDKE